ncbi:MAG: molecular chaperone TorD family protein [Coriobacteriia bacterium]|nr:molecular chaperone TorD family protein [Coriobacteriia bacterium]
MIMMAGFENSTAKSNALNHLSLLWLRPQKDEWDELVSHASINELVDQLKLGFGIDVDAQELLDLAPAFDEAYTFNTQVLSMNFAKKSAAPIESIYKIWTIDPNCNLQNARQKGFVMGDPAYHMKDLMKSLEISLPEDFIEMPDHLSVILSLASVFLEAGNFEAYKTFVTDHLDWMEDYQKRLENLDTHGFYLALLAIVQNIYKSEIAR